MEDLHFHFYSNLLVSKVFCDVDANCYNCSEAHFVPVYQLMCLFLSYFCAAFCYSFLGGGGVMFTVVYLENWL